MQIYTALQSKPAPQKPNQPPSKKDRPTPLDQQGQPFASIPRLFKWRCPIQAIICQLRKGGHPLMTHPYRGSTSCVSITRAPLSAACRAIMLAIVPVATAINASDKAIVRTVPDTIFICFIVSSPMWPGQHARASAVVNLSRQKRVRFNET